MFIDSNKNYKLKVAFDYDQTLDQKLFFDLAKHLINKGHDVWILTARLGTYEKYIEYMGDNNRLPKYVFDEFNSDILKTAKELGIPEEKIIFTNYDSKDKHFFNHKFDLLFDDDSVWHCNGICKNGGLAISV